MDKSKRTDLLAAGRKKLLQFRQKKGGSKDGKSSSKGSNVEKDSEAEEPEESVKVQEPVKISESELTASAVGTTSPDPSISQDPKPAGDQTVAEQGGDTNQALSKPLVVEEGDAEMLAEVEQKETVSSLLEESYSEGTQAGILSLDNGNDEAGAKIAPLSQHADGLKEEAAFATSNLEPDNVVVKPVDSAVERADGEQTTLILIDNSEPTILVVENGQEGLIEVGNIGSELKMPQDENEVSIPLDATNGYNVDINLDRNLMQAQRFSHGQEPEGLPANLDRQSTSRDDFEHNQEAAIKGIELEEKSEIPPSYDASTSFTSMEENKEIPAFVQVSPSPREQEGSDKQSERTEDEVVKGSVELFREAIHERSRLVGEFREEGFLSHREMFEGIKGCTTKSSYLAPSSDTWYLNNRFFHEDNFYDELESIMRYLYLTSVVRDLLQLQLDEHDEINGQFSRQSHELTKLQTLVKEAQENNVMLNEELAECRFQFQSVTIAKNELEIQLQIKQEEIQELHDKSSLCLNRLDSSQQELSSLSSQLDACRTTFDTLQKENLALTENFHLETGMRRKVEGDNESLAHENARLASELLEQKEKLLIALNKQIQLECNLREADSCIEQLVKENFCLSNSLDMHKIKIEELQNKHFGVSLPPQKLEPPINNFKLEIALDGASADSQCTPGSLAVSSYSESHLLQHADGEISDSSMILGSLKGHVKEVKSILNNLEKSIHSMYSESQSLSRSGGRTPNFGVSKLIQAFESKTAIADDTSQEVQSTEGARSHDSYSSTKEQADLLSDMLEQMEFAITKLEAHVLKENNSRALLKNMEMENLAQKQRHDVLQASFDELASKLIDYRYRIDHIEKKFDEVCQFANDEAAKSLFQVELLQEKVKETESLIKQEKDYHLGVILGSVKKLDEYTGLQTTSNMEIDEHVVASVDAATKSIDVLQRELHDANLSCETVQKVHAELNDLFIAAQQSNELAFSHIHRLYVMLGEVLQESCMDADELNVDLKNEKSMQLLHERCQMLVIQLQKLLDERNKLLSKNSELESGWLSQSEEIQKLNQRCNDLLEQVTTLHYAKDGLESVLTNKTQCLDEASRRCLALIKKLDNYQPNKYPDDPSEFAGGGELAMTSENMESYSIRFLIPHLEELVAHYIQKYEEIVEQVNLSKDYLLKVDIVPKIAAEKWSLPLPTFLKEEFLPKIWELKDQLDILIASNIKHEAELNIYMDYSSRIVDALESSRSELILKMSELEQSEQRLSSVREKLSIAVSKGKGLVVQRDSLKQSLLEKSSALEKYSQELHSKEILLKELEAKLKSYSEVDRIESLESELSYIRNSATALRDSFLLKDSVLQRIEEVLEGLEFPEQFHSRDIVDKIELMSRMVSNNSSFTTVDWGKNYSMEESHSDEGFIVMDDHRNDLQASSYSGSHELENTNNEFERKFYGLTEQKETLGQHSVERDRFDELKNEHQDLERRFYGLAEHKEMLEQSLAESDGKFNEMKNRHGDLERRYDDLAEKNEMLEQSLLEANSLAKKLEEVLDRIHMPPHSRSLEPVDKIEWLRHTVWEAQRERNELQLKIENLEASTGTLSVELDESHKKMSELRAELLAIKCEKDSISESLDKVKFENLEFSERIMQEASLGDSLQKELAELQKKIAEKVQELYDMENEIWRLLTLAGSTLGDNYKHECLSEGSATSCLEKLLSKLVREYSNLNAEKIVPKDSQEELLFDGKQSTSDMTTSTDASDVREQELYNMKLELNEALSNVEFLNAEKNELMENCNSLKLENEGLRQKELLLQEEIKTEEKNNQYLVSEVEVLQKEKDTLQEQLTQEEQKSASVREKLNVAVRKGKGLVQHRDSLKQTIEEMNIMVEHLKSENNQRIEALESEKLLLVNKLTETEQNLQFIDHNLNRLLAVSDVIHVEAEKNDPVQKLEELSKSYCNLCSTVSFLEQEKEKSKRVADLLLTELNEVQERADILQEELRRAEAARDDVLRRLEQESKNQVDNLTKLKMGIEQARKAYVETRNAFADAYNRHADLFCSVEYFMESFSKQISSNASPNLPSINRFNKVDFNVIDAPSEDDMHEQADDLSISQQFYFAVHNVLEYARDYDELKRNIQRYSLLVDQHSSHLLKMMDSLEGKFSLQREEYESLRRDVSGFESMIEEKENENATMRRNLSLLYQACCTSISEIEVGNSQIAKVGLAFEKHDFNKAALDLKSWKPVGWQEPLDVTASLFPEELIRSLSDKLLSAVKGAQINAVEGGNLKELKSTLSELRKELQEKDFQMNKVCQDLVSQIRNAEAVTKKYSHDLDSAKATIQKLEKQTQVIEHENKSLKSRINELEDLEALASDSQEKLKSLADALATKDQEIEALMQALDEEETQFGEQESKNKELENLLQEKDLTMKNLEASREKALAKLSTTVSKFDELHDLSESLLSEVENLQSQLQVQDSEISFLRQEATRCTNDFLSSQEVVKKYSSELYELLKWMEMMTSLFGLTQIPYDGDECSQVRSFTNVLGKRIATLVAESDDLHVAIQKKDSLLQAERARVEDLSGKFEALESSLREKENQIDLLHQGRSSGQTSRDFSGPLESDQMKNKQISGTVVTHVRGGRRVNGDQIAIAIDTEKADNLLGDEDDDKAHGFRALTKSRFIPRLSRPITDRIDAIWVSGDRLLMRQPTLRLGVVIYWIALHALLVGLI